MRRIFARKLSDPHNEQSEDRTLQSNGHPSFDSGQGVNRPKCKFLVDKIVGKRHRFEFLYEGACTGGYVDRIRAVFTVVW